MNRKIRIGTRSSDLAMWQATTVAGQLEHFGCETEIVKIDSIGDVVLDRPLYELGIVGVFTKNLDVALLNGTIDIAVHSYKDVPTKMPDGIVEAAIIKRGDFNDVLIMNEDENFFEKEEVVIATGSLRRKAQWLHNYPHHKVVGLRGNVNTRLQKLEDNGWDGAIFAKAGLKRLKKLPAPEQQFRLDWMVPAPAQGAVMVACMGNDEELVEYVKQINHEETAICTKVEREFLRVLEGGCTAPIGALAFINKETIKFKGVLFSPDGTKKLEYTKELPVDKCKDMGKKGAEYILSKGGKKLMRELLDIEKPIQVFSTKSLSNDQTKDLGAKVGLTHSDFINIKYNRIRPTVVKNSIQNVIITSQNAVESLLQSFSPIELQFENIYCVGRRTKRLIESKIGKVTAVKKSSKELAEYLVNEMEGKEATYFCGNLKRDELPEILTSNGIELNEVEAYKTVLSSKKIEDKYSGVLFFSPSGIESYLQDNEPGERVAFCIGGTTGSEAEKYFKEVEIAQVATVESVISKVNTYYNQAAKTAETNH